MKLFSKKTISILLIFITGILLFISIYYAHKKYLAYQEVESMLTKRELFDNANKLLISLEKERLRSSLYLANPNQKNLDKLNHQRKKVNRYINQNKKLIITKEVKVLLNIRHNLNTLSVDYRSLIYEAFHKNIIMTIISKVEQLNLFTNDLYELQFIKLRENINMENSFLAFTLTKKNMMTDADVLFWDKVLNLRQRPSFDSNKNEVFLSRLGHLPSISNFLNIGQKERVELFVSAKKGVYSISFSEWLNKTRPQHRELRNIQKLHSDENMANLTTERFLEKEEMDRYIIISLLMLILLGLLLALLHILKKINKDEIVLKNTVKEIEVELDENKKREIKEILTHNSSSEVYKFLANEIKEPSRAKDLFLANMSHEIRTPLNGIMGFTKELKETTLSEEQVEIVSIIEESSENLMHIVNDILDFSKIKAGKVELESIAFDPIEKFETSIDTYVAKAREKEIELKVCIDPEVPVQVLGDPTKITQILNNLISNAIKFTPNKGSVDITIQKIPTDVDTEVQLKFSVKDSGIGVTSKEKKKIFDAFSQADASTSRKYGGTGLGLSIASQFIKRMGGELEIESQVGEGARFFFSLSLEKPGELIQRPKTDLSKYKIGYIPPLGNRSVDKNLKTYIEYQEAEFATYTQRTLLNLEESKLPDLLYIDYKCFDDEGEIEYFLDLPLKIVLIVADNREKELLGIRSKIDKILHKPVNFTRTLKSLKVLQNSIENNKSAVHNKSVDFKNMHALVAEDNIINQKLIKSVLERLGLEVTVVSNGREALKSREHNKFNIIFMDIQMPVMGGVEATKSILSYEDESQQKHIPIVALTANALEGDKEKYMSQGMDAYLTKPMDVNKLKSVLNDFLG